MRRLISFTVMGLFLVSTAAVPVFSQSTSDILEKIIEATGGRKALEAIKDTTLEGEMEMPSMGMSAVMTIYHKEPNKFRQEMEIVGMAMTNAFDGEVGWTLNPMTGSVEDVTGVELEQSKKSSFDFGNSALLHPEKYGISYEFKGKEQLEGKEYLVLAQTFPSGEIDTLYFDSGTYLLHRVKQMGLDMMGAPIDQELFFADYKKVDGVMASFAMTILQGGEEFAVITITEVKYNSGLEDSFFSKEK